MDFKFPQLDLLSFALGFTLATVFWLIILRISKLLPKMRQSAAENRLKQESRKNISREHNIRLFTLRKAQGNHLASAMFPLEKIIVEPSVLAPPDCLPDIGEDIPRSGLNSVMPYTPEVPELSADFPALRIPLEILINSYQFVCLSGEPGSGKSTALSALASTLAVDERKALPILVASSALNAAEKPALDSILEFVNSNVTGSSSANIAEIIVQSSTHSRFVLLIDDMDELDKPAFDQMVERIKELQAALPNIRIVVTSSTYYTGSLEEIGFNPFTLAAWGQEERNKFISVWAKALSEISKPPSDELLALQTQRIERTSLWLAQENACSIPFDITLKVWLSLANAIQSAKPTQLYESYLKFVSENRITFEGYIALAEAITRDGSEIFSASKVTEVLNSKPDYLIREEVQRQAEVNKTNPFTRGNKIVDKRLSASELVELLVANRLFILLPDGNLKFAHMLMPAFLGSRIESNVQMPLFAEILQSPVKHARLLQKSSFDHDLAQFTAWFDQNDSPVHRNYLSGLNWLKQTSAGDPQRTEIYKRIARQLQDRSIPFGLRARFTYHIAKTNDQSIISLLTILKGSQEYTVRQLAALGLGLFDDEKATAALAELSTDHANEVQNIAVAALGRIWTPAAQDALVNVIFNADEPVRANACELLGLHKPDGHEMLREIMATDNYLARKAAISGLRKINEPWVHDLLEKTSLEDTQWVVRDSAIFALEHLADNAEFIPAKWLPVHENPWTLLKSEEHSVELSPKTFPTSLLMTVLEKGHDGDKRIAMHYLLSSPMPEFIKKLTQLARQENSGVREEAINALFDLSKRGLEVK